MKVINWEEIMSIVGPSSYGTDLLMEHGIVGFDIDRYVKEGEYQMPGTGAKLPQPLDKDTLEKPATIQDKPTNYKAWGLGTIGAYLAGVILTKGKKNPLDWKIGAGVKRIGRSVYGALKRVFTKERGASVWGKVKTNLLDIKPKA